jgi:hypothetical protein
MIFCARRRLDSDGPCEGRKHIDSRLYSLHGQEPKCLVCGRVVVVIYGVSPITNRPFAGDTMWLEDGDQIISYPEDLREIHRRQDECDGWPPIDEIR